MLSSNRRPLERAQGATIIAQGFIRGFGSADAPFDTPLGAIRARWARIAPRGERTRGTQNENPGINPWVWSFYICGRGRAMVEVGR